VDVNNIYILYMNHFFSFHNKKRFLALPTKKNVLPNKIVNNKSIVIRQHSTRPKHSFRQGLINRLANPSGCACGK